jgi:hypothetical protein
MFELQFSVQPARQGPHQLKAQPAIGGWIEILRKTDAVIRHFDHEGAIVFGLAPDMHLHRQSRRMRVLAGIGQKLSGDKSGMKGVARVDVAIAAMIDGQIHLSFRAERSDHLGNFLQEIAEVYTIAVGGQRQRLVQFRRDLDARTDIVEQHADLLGREGFVALRNRVALKANNTAQAGQVVRDPVVGLSHPDKLTFDQN